MPYEFQEDHADDFKPSGFSLGIIGKETLASEFMPPCVAIRGRVGDRVFKTHGDKIVEDKFPNSP